MFSPVFVCVCVCVCVCVLACRQDFTKTTEQISTKLGWRMSLSTEQTSVTFGMDPDEKTDSRLSS